MTDTVIKIQVDTGDSEEKIDNMTNAVNSAAESLDLYSNAAQEAIGEAAEFSP
jgi:hypothetical protein